MATRRGRGLEAHPFAWVVEPLRQHPSFFDRAMFGCRGIYLHGRLVLVLAARGREPWQGLLVPTEREHHGALRAELPALRPHPVLGKWLYLPESDEVFEETAAELAERAAADDPRIGVEPSAKRLSLRPR